MLKRVKVTRNADGQWAVNLPTYFMQPGSWQPITPGVVHADGIDPKADPLQVQALGVTVLVEVPDAYGNADKSDIDPAKVAKLHNDVPKWSAVKSLADLNL